MADEHCISDVNIQYLKGKKDKSSFYICSPIQEVELLFPVKTRSLYYEDT